MTTLPYDYERCAGTEHPTCQQCRRREHGREQWQPTIAPPINVDTGECCEFIEPLGLNVEAQARP